MIHDEENILKNTGDLIARPADRDSLAEEGVRAVADETSLLLQKARSRLLLNLLETPDVIVAI